MMEQTEYTIYNSLTGQIIRMGRCPREHIPMQCVNPNETYCLGMHSRDNYILDGKVVPLKENPAQVSATTISTGQAL